MVAETKSPIKATYRRRSLFSAHNLRIQSVHHAVWGPSERGGTAHIREALPSSVKPFWKHAHRQTQRCVSTIILYPFHLTVNTNHLPSPSPSLLKPSSSHTWPWIIFDFGGGASKEVARHGHLSARQHLQRGDGVCWSHSFCTLYAVQTPWWRLCCLFHSAHDCPPAVIITVASFGVSADNLLY